MVLNFTGLSSLKYQFHLSEVVLLILSMLLGILSCLWLDEVIKLCAGQCLLFAKLYERARILQGSSLWWCYLPTCLHLIAVLCSLCVLSFVRGGRYGSQSNCSRVLGLISLSTVLVFISSWIISYGFREFCKSFVINRCNRNHIHSMDWKNFIPKYCDCENSYRSLQQIEASSWAACLLLFMLCVTHIVRLCGGLQTTSRQ